MERAVLVAAAREGTPVWVFDLDMIADNCRRLDAAGGSFNARFHYAIKANDHPAVLAAVEGTGTGAEAASFREYDLARSAGFESARIVFNGPLKTDSELAAALGAGALVNVDSLAELERALALRIHGARIGVRLQTNLLEGVVGDRFGLAEGEVMEAARRLRESGSTIEQLHTHVGSYAVTSGEGPTARRLNLIWPRGPELTRRICRGLLKVVALVTNAGCHPASISLGGGLPAPDHCGPHFDAVLEELQSSPDLAVVFEPGRAIVMGAGAMVTRVVSIRKSAAAKQEVVVDAGTHLLPSAQWKDLRLSSLGDVDGELIPTTVFGPLCLQSDVLAWESPLPACREGDLLVVEDVGAYNLIRSSPFIFSLAPVAFLEDGKLRLGPR
ncbi:MAG: hypothetical protein WEB00_01455 [Dehalococcoidia bacterium]